jgi:hypothetical protein
MAVDRCIFRSPKWSSKECPRGAHCSTRSLLYRCSRTITNIIMLHCSRLLHCLAGRKGSTTTLVCFGTVQYSTRWGRTGMVKSSHEVAGKQESLCDAGIMSVGGRATERDTLHENVRFASGRFINTGIGCDTGRVEPTCHWDRTWRLNFGLLLLWYGRLEGVLLVDRVRNGLSKRTRDIQWKDQLSSYARRVMSSWRHVM